MIDFINLYKMIRSFIVPCSYIVHADAQKRLIQPMHGSPKV